MAFSQTDQAAAARAPNPYDDVPYRSLPIEWAAPERLALTALLHGGPRVSLGSYRVLELGCGNGANILPLAYHRRQAAFVGVDSAEGAIEVAEARKAELDLPNLQFIRADFGSAAAHLSGRFDFILAHGVFSWVPGSLRDRLFALCASLLRPRGLLYLNYNTKPGWNIRGMVREFLLRQTAGTASLRDRAQRAQDVAATVAASLASAVEHPYSRLMEREFRFVCDSHCSYVAHEYLAVHNRSYWQSEFLTLARRYGFAHVADADFNYSSGRIPEELPERIAAAQLVGQPLEDTVDLLSYRQLHSPIFTIGAWRSRPPTVDEFANLFVAACLAPMDPDATGTGTLRHPSGFEVEAKTAVMWSAFEKLRVHWPRGLPVGALFPDVVAAIDDLRLLHRHGLIELRLVEPDFASSLGSPLNEAERRWGGYHTTPYHTLEGVPT